MHRFYVARGINGDKIFIFDAGQIHHLKDVLRLKVEDEVVTFDDSGNEYTCSITALSKWQAVLTIKAMKSAETKKTKITVACAIPKKGMDEIVDNLTQLGVDAIMPVETERVIVRLDDSQKEARLRRWRMIARSAAQQSQRSSLPLIEPVKPLESVVAHSGDFDLKLIPALVGERRPVKEVLAESKPGQILVLIGPEGDFTPGEIALAKNAGFIPVSLGDSVLRVGMAAVAVVSYIRLSLTA
jgi:16S rRNA (uracil1498-N3)-methyltransferase